AVRSEMAYTLGDICRRRTMLSLQSNYGMDALEAIAQTLQAHCGWSAAEWEQAIADYKTLMAENCIPDYDMERILGRQVLTSVPSSTGESARQLAVG
ncbi:MAG: glycerol-3-phosphate dehydrogenase C-terminal domain-containing protein, partial [Cyanobacteria bacterium J06631_12]